MSEDRGSRDDAESEPDIGRQNGQDQADGSDDEPIVGEDSHDHGDAGSGREGHEHGDSHAEPTAGRLTAPMQPYGKREVGIGFLILLAGVVLAYALPLVAA